MAYNPKRYVLASHQTAMAAMTAGKPRAHFLHLNTTTGT
jgi:hypothetical protein